VLVVVVVPSAFLVSFVVIVVHVPPSHFVVDELEVFVDVVPVDAPPASLFVVVLEELDTELDSELEHFWHVHNPLMYPGH